MIKFTFTDQSQVSNLKEIALDAAKYLNGSNDQTISFILDSVGNVMTYADKKIDRVKAFNMIALGQFEIALIEFDDIFCTKN